MFGKLRIALFFAGVVTAAVVQAQPGNPAQNRVDSLVSQLKNTEAGEQFRAVAELGDLGPLAKSAVPELVKTLNQSDDLALKHEVLIALGRIGTESAQAVPEITKFLKNESPLLQHAAIHALRQIGPAAKAAVPELSQAAKSDNLVIAVSAAWGLVSVAEDQQTRVGAIPILVKGLESQEAGVVGDAFAGLVEIGKPAVPELVSRLQKDDQVAVLAADTLATIGPAAEGAIRGLLSALQSQNEKVAARAARALGYIGGDSNTVVPSLSSHLADPSEEVRVASARGLGSFGAGARTAVPALTRALEDKAIDVRVAAAQALGAIGPEARSAVPALDRALDDSAGIVTYSAAEALGSIKGPAVEVLARRLDQPAFLPLAAAVLGNIGPEAAPAVPALVRHLGTQEPESQLEVLLAIGSIGPKAAPAATKPLLELLKSAEGRAKRGAVYALAKIGAKEVTPQLQEGVRQSDDPLFQRTCAWALVTLDPENAEYVELALPRLMAGLSDEMPLIRKECAIAIQKIGPEAKAAVPELVRALETSDPEVQAEILDALAKIGPEAKPAIPAAVKLLDGPDPMAKYTAMHFLGTQGEAAKDAAPALEKHFAGRDEFGKAVAAWALVNIDPSAEHIRQATPLMIQALDHFSPLVRAMAAEILGKIGRGNSEVQAALEKARRDQDETVRQAAEKALRMFN